MFHTAYSRQGSLGAAVRILELIYHCSVRSVRETHNNAIMAIGINLLQAVIFVLTFYLMFSLLGLQGSTIRGDFLLYIMSGIFIFLTHTKALSAVVQSEGPASPMMQHAPMNTAVAITSAALAALYIQVLTMVIMLFIYHVGFEPITVDEPAAAFSMLLISWGAGVALGILLLAIKPWYPQFVSLFSTIYQRANMIASGKMFVANSLPGYMLAMFDWNPLFHCIDQARGFIFINYNPHHTDWHYALWVTVAVLTIGMMGEFYTRRHASISWGARR